MLTIYLVILLDFLIKHNNLLRIIIKSNHTMNIKFNVINKIFHKSNMITNI